MNLSEQFTSNCRDLGFTLNCGSPSFKTYKGKKSISARAASFSFDEFKLDIAFYENGGSLAPQQTLWLTFVLNCDEAIPFSIYDILAFTEPKNFNCYTFSYVDSNELMNECFIELEEILKRTIPKLNSLLENGIEKNKLLNKQKESINKYFGDDVLESGEMIGAAADKIINLMIKTFHDSELEAATAGSQSYFYVGKDEKALKKLKKAKFKTLYQQNLIAFLENGGSSEGISKTAIKASLTKGSVRHSGGFKGVLKYLATALLISIPVTLALVLVFYIICKISFSGSILFIGFRENIFTIYFYSFFASFIFAAQLEKYLRKKKKNYDKKAVQRPELSSTINFALKYASIAAETLAIVGCLTGINSTVAFYENNFKYSQEDIALSQSVCDYSVVDFIGVIGDKKDSLAEKESYLVVRTKSGNTINLYNSTFLSADDFSERANFLKDKGIEIKKYKNYKDYEKDL